MTIVKVNAHECSLKEIKTQKWCDQGLDYFKTHPHVPTVAFSHCDLEHGRVHYEIKGK